MIFFTLSVTSDYGIFAQNYVRKDKREKVAPIAIWKDLKFDLSQFL